MVADAEIVTMGEVNQRRINRLANALKEKNDLGRSHSARYPAVAGSPEARGVQVRHPAVGHMMNIHSVGSVEDAATGVEFRRRACTMPSKVEPPYPPVVYSQAPMLSPRSPPGRGTVFEYIPAAPPRLGTGNADEAAVVGRVRAFTLDPDRAAVINRGDSFRCRSNTGGVPSMAPRGGRSLNGSSKNSSNFSSRSHSPVPVIMADGTVNPADLLSPVATEDAVRKYHIVVLGSTGVGKTSIINQFMTSDYCNPFQKESGDVPEENTVNVLLDGEESQLTFIEVNNEKNDMWLSLSGAGYMVVYSVEDLVSFRNAEQALCELRQRLHASCKPIILVANKIDLERKRLVSVEDGRYAAKEYNCKFVEIAVALGHHVDELLVGVLTQVRQNEDYDANLQVSGSKSELIAAFDSAFLSGVLPNGRSSSGSSSGSNNAGTRNGRWRNHKKTLVDKELKNGMEKWNSLKKLDHAMTSGCTHMASVGGRFVQKLFGRRRRSHSLEDLLAFQRR